MIVRKLRRGQIASWENFVPKFFVRQRSFLPILYHEQPRSMMWIVRYQQSAYRIHAQD